MQKISNFDVEIDVIPNRLEKYMAFTINKKKIIGSMQFMNSSLDTLVKNLSDNDFKHLSQEFSDEQFNLIKKRSASIWIHGTFWKVFWRTITCKTFISKTEYLHANNVWNMFQMFKWIKWVIIMVFI